jgi:uncharacterized membrane protein
MKIIRWLIAVAVIATLTHGALLYFGPSLIMSRAMGRMAERGGWNTMTHAPRVNATNDTIVRSSPDLLYSVCPYDLAYGSLRIFAEVPKGTYWSMSFYDMNTNNYRVINDAEASAGMALVVVRRPTNESLTPVGAEVINSPSDRGLVLIRTLINDDARLAEIDKVRRSATCTAF